MMLSKLVTDVNELIDYCNAPSIRQASGLIMSMELSQINALMAEFKRKPDMRFGDNLLNACSLIKKLKTHETTYHLFYY